MGFVIKNASDEAIALSEAFSNVGLSFKIPLQ